MAQVENDFEKVASIIAIIIAFAIVVYTLRHLFFLCKCNNRIHTTTQNTNRTNERNSKIINVLPAQ